MKVGDKMVSVKKLLMTTSDSKNVSILYNERPQFYYKIV